MKKINKKDTKAWLRIVEAIIGILIIVGVILIIMSKQPPKADNSDEIHEKQRKILEIISKNDELRGEILTPSSTKNNQKINNFIKKRIPNNWGFATNICKINEVCPNPEPIYNREVYAEEVVISSTLNAYDSGNIRKLRFFAWME